MVFDLTLTLFLSYLGVLIFLLCLSAFFSGSETALTALSRARLHELERRGDRRAGIVAALTSSRDRLIGTLLLGNNLINILASSLSAALFIKVFGDPGILYATLIMTVLVLIFAEILPKTYAILHPERAALWPAPFTRFVVFILSPFVGIVMALVRFFLRLLRIDSSGDSAMLSAYDELRGAINLHHQEGSVVKDDRDMLGAILDLHHLELSDVMVHRTHMYSVDIKRPVSSLIEDIMRSGHSRVPVWDGSPDNVIGILHVKDLLGALHKSGGDLSRIEIGDLCAPAWFVPDTTSVSAQLKAFRVRKNHFALVVDEYGEVEGLVTLEDILEEIVGDIDDEHDITRAGLRRDGLGGYIVEGVMPVRDLNRILDWDLPEEEATTIAGLVIHEARIIPDIGQVFTFYGHRFEILRKRRNHISVLRISA